MEVRPPSVASPDERADLAAERSEVGTRTHELLVRWLDGTKPLAPEANRQPEASWWTGRPRRW
ncbi:hypothetical protein AAH979_34625 [Plantactinospora sp. ZYX-F-223]|uniref:hypothetical protein n=1 Tax=Plantactinospora sp. ZYX-F-223 TaxID=3144103 RepID=UPI0031FBD648